MISRPKSEEKEVKEHIQALTILTKPMTADITMAARAHWNECNKNEGKQGNSVMTNTYLTTTRSNYNLYATDIP